MSEADVVNYLVDGVMEHLSTGVLKEDLYDWIDPQFSEHEPSKELMKVHKKIVKYLLDTFMFKMEDFLNKKITTKIYDDFVAINIDEEVDE